MKPSLDDLIKQALKLPPGPKAWAVIFEHYPELILTPEALANDDRCSTSPSYVPRSSWGAVSRMGE
jgi:hypothetical protein